MTIVNRQNPTRDWDQQWINILENHWAWNWRAKKSCWWCFVPHHISPYNCICALKLNQWLLNDMFPTHPQVVGACLIYQGLTSQRFSVEWVVIIWIANDVIRKYLRYCMARYGKTNHKTCFMTVHVKPEPFQSDKNVTKTWSTWTNTVICSEPYRCMQRVSRFALSTVPACCSFSNRPRGGAGTIAARHCLHNFCATDLGDEHCEHWPLWTILVCICLYGIFVAYILPVSSRF